MGVDVNLYAEATPTPEELAAAEAFFGVRSSIGDSWGDRDRVLVADCGRVEVQTLERYYGPGYERGNWPRIYGAIRALQAAFPGSKVYYGGDSSDDGELCTPEMLAAIWDHLLSERGNSYREVMRRATQ